MDAGHDRCDVRSGVDARPSARRDAVTPVRVDGLARDGDPTAFAIRFRVVAPLVDGPRVRTATSPTSVEAHAEGRSTLGHVSLAKAFRGREHGRPVT